MILHAARPGDDRTTTALFQQHKNAIREAGGEVWTCLTMSTAPAWILCELPEGKDPNLIAPLPEPNTWQLREQVQ